MQAFCGRGGGGGGVPAACVCRGGCRVKFRDAAWDYKSRLGFEVTQTEALSPKP